MHWLFGYGSLIWRPDIDFVDRRPARIYGWQRRFWQGSHDHRGVPDRPGRVVTLIQNARSYCDGMAYLVDAETIDETFARLDHREKNGYERFAVELHLAAAANALDATPANDQGCRAEGLVYIAPQDNHAYLGPASIEEIAVQVRHAAGPSGRNVDYVLELATALRGLGADDPHVFALEAAVRGFPSA